MSAAAADNDPIATDRAFAAAADKLALGDYPEATPLSDGGLIVLRLDSTVPPTAVPLDKIKRQGRRRPTCRRPGQGPDSPGHRHSDHRQSRW